MKRREFLTMSAVAGAAPFLGGGKLFAQSSDQQYFELRQYHLHPGAEQRENFNTFLREVAIPAYNRMGIEPVGVLTAMYGTNRLSTFVLLPHPNLESVVTSSQQLLDDQKVQRQGEDFITVSSEDINYVRIESSLMVAFEGMPEIAMPAAAKNNEPRIFELRRYESHNLRAAKRKVEMFNKGEIQIFKDTGLQPVFFGETVIGPYMPNLTYMLWFEDLEQRDERWDVFRNSPAWEKLSADPYYADTVSDITDIILRPADYSQI
jgi:hypothetical protein